MHRASLRFWAGSQGAPRAVSGANLLRAHETRCSSSRARSGRSRRGQRATVHEWSVARSSAPTAAGTSRSARRPENGGWHELAVPEACRTVFQEAAKDECFGGRRSRSSPRIQARGSLGCPKKLRVTFDYFGAALWYLHTANARAAFRTARRSLSERSRRWLRLLLAAALVAVRSRCVGHQAVPVSLVRKSSPFDRLCSHACSSGTIGYLALARRDSGAWALRRSRGASRRAAHGRRHPRDRRNPRGVLRSGALRDRRRALRRLRSRSSRRASTARRARRNPAASSGGEVALAPTTLAGPCWRCRCRTGDRRSRWPALPRGGGTGTGGKSELHRARCRVTPGGGNAKESATEKDRLADRVSVPPGKGETAG